MTFTLQIELSADSATPVLKQLYERSQPRRLAETLREPLLALVCRHYESLPPNKNHWPSTGFWRSASDSTYAVEGEDGLTITTYKIGVRQRLLGAPINALRVNNISIPACAETYGKLPRDFTDLVLVQFGRGQDAPKALVRVRQDSPFPGLVEPKTLFTVMFWLKNSVKQNPNPAVLPPDDEFFSIIDETLNSLLTS